MISIILTVHNKDFLLEKVLQRIFFNTNLPYELIIVLDGCTDNSKNIVNSFIIFYENYELSYYKDNLINIKVLEAPNVFETKANNLGIRNSNGEYFIIVQDDMIINEYGWNERLLKPFKTFDDIFAVTARTAHNWKINSNSIHVNEKENRNDCWSDILIHTDHAHKDNLGRDTFGIRDCVNRGPLAIRRYIFDLMGGFDEEFYPQGDDDHDFCFRTYKKTKLRCGCYPIDFISKDEWGGTRENGKTKKWMFQANQKNTKILLHRHKEMIELGEIKNENRKLS